MNLPIVRQFNRVRLFDLADGLAAAVAVSLPWSTSATGILLALLLLALIPTLEWHAVGIQLGFFGIAVLWAMWISQLMYFWGTGLVAWIGLVIVVQNIVGSLFNSFIFDFTESWLYGVGVGVAAGMLQRQFYAAQGHTDVAVTTAVPGP
jgi:hypothetical protein